MAKSGNKIEGLQVIDAANGIKIRVTPRDIEAATQKDPKNCAFAKACKRELDVAEARIHKSRVYLRSGTMNWVRFMAPPGLREEIIALDRGGKFEPQEFELKAPTPSTRLGISHKQTAPKKRKGGPKRKRPHILVDVRGVPPRR